MRKIALTVCLTHCFILLCMCIHHFSTKKYRSDKPISVRTFTQQPQIAPRPVAQEKRRESAKPVAKKEHVKPEKKKGPIAKKTESKKVTETVENVVVKPQPKKSPLSIPLPVKACTDNTPILTDPTDCEWIIAFLQEMLELPEFGWVKAKIEIDEGGHVAKCEIIDSQSEKNAQFLKTHLKDLTFPVQKTRQNYVINFKNNP